MKVHRDSESVQNLHPFVFHFASAHANAPNSRSKVQGSPTELKCSNRSNCSIPRIESGVRSSVEVKPGTGGKKGRSAGIDFITYLPETRLSGILPIFDGCKLVSELRTTARGQNPSSEVASEVARVKSLPLTLLQVLELSAASDFQFSATACVCETR